MTIPTAPLMIEQEYRHCDDCYVAVRKPATSCADEGREHIRIDVSHDQYTYRQTDCPFCGTPNTDGDLCTPCSDFEDRAFADMLAAEQSMQNPFPSPERWPTG